MSKLDNLGDFLTDIADTIRTKKGTSGTISAQDFSSEIASIPSGSPPIFSGSYDTAGLTAIGWTQAEIDYYNQNGVQWNSSENSYFELNATELAGDESNSTRFLPKSSTKTNFQNYYILLAIPLINTSSLTSAYCMFYECNSLTAIPLIDTSKITDMSSMFYNCYSLNTIPLLDTSKLSNINSMFTSCYSLKTIPLIDTSNVIQMSDVFKNCYSLKVIPSLNTSKVVNMLGFARYCKTLTTIPLLDTGAVTNIGSAFNNDTRLTTLGGFKDLGKSYSTGMSANYSSYKLDLSSSTQLTEQSIINVLNNLYDIATKGCNTQQCTLGSTNLAKLTSAEGQQALADAQTKGWSLS